MQDNTAGVALDYTHSYNSYWSRCAAARTAKNTAYTAMIRVGVGKQLRTQTLTRLYQGGIGRRANRIGSPQDEWGRTRGGERGITVTAEEPKCGPFPQSSLYVRIQDACTVWNRCSPELLLSVGLPCVFHHWFSNNNNKTIDIYDMFLTRHCPIMQWPV